MSALKRLLLAGAGTAVVTFMVAATPASADSITPAPATSSSDVSILAIPAGCSGWTDWYGGHGRGHLNCVGSGRDVRVTVACGDGSIKRSATGYEYAKAECPSGLGAVGVSGAYV